MTKVQRLPRVQSVWLYVYHIPLTLTDIVDLTGLNKNHLRRLRAKGRLRQRVMQAVKELETQNERRG